MAESVYEAVGGQPFFDELVDRFYDGVASDPVLRPLYPEDLAPARQRLAGFLAQYWGGPQHYSDQRGHPRLRMRHAPFAIGPAERDAWLQHMLASVDAADLPTEIQQAMTDYFRMAADHLVNQPAGDQSVLSETQPPAHQVPVRVPTPRRGQSRREPPRSQT